MKEHFEKVLGVGNVSDNENDLLAYGYDGGEIYGKARLVLWPDSEEQLRLILTFCNRSNLDVIIRGNASNTNGMTVPHNSIVINTLNFNRLRAINVTEQWVDVDCGVTITDLNKALREHGFRYPLEPDNNLLTVGGCLATNAATRQSHKYGRAKDTVVSLDIMDGTGKSFTVTKDHQDYLGLEGTVFYILRAKLKIVPVLVCSADIQYFDTVHEALAEADLRAEEKPLSMVLLDSIAATYAGFNTKHTLFIEWNDNRGLIQHEQYALLVQKLHQLRKLLGQQGYVLLEDGETNFDKREAAIEWCRQHDLLVESYPGLGIIQIYAKREQDTIRHEFITWLVAQQQKPIGTSGYGSRKKMHVPLTLKAKIRTLKDRYDYNNIFGRGKLHDYI